MLTSQIRLPHTPVGLMRGDYGRWLVTENICLSLISHRHCGAIRPIANLGSGSSSCRHVVTLYPKHTVGAQTPAPLNVSSDTSSEPQVGQSRTAIDQGADPQICSLKLPQALWVVQAIRFLSDGLNAEDLALPRTPFSAVT